MKISEKIKHPFRRQPPTGEELAAWAEAGAVAAKKSSDLGKADVETQAARNTYFAPGF